MEREEFEYLFIHANSFAELSLCQVAFELAGSSVELPELDANEREAQALALLDQMDMSLMMDSWEWGKDDQSETAISITEDEPVDAAPHDPSMPDVKPAVQSDSSSNDHPFADTTGRIDVGTYLERAYASRDQIANDVEAVMAKVDMAMLDALLGTFPADLSPITGRLNAEELTQWVDCYRFSNHRGLNEVVALIRNLIFCEMDMLGPFTSATPEKDVSMHFRLRSFHRKSIDSSINVQSSDLDLVGELANIGLGGVFVKSEDEAPVVIGKVYKLSFRLPLASAATHIQVNGMAIRKSRHGVAFRFLEMDVSSLKPIFDFLYHAVAEVDTEAQLAQRNGEAEVAQLT